MKGPLNPKLEVGDRIVLLHMEGETSVIPGTEGTVIKITRDPFEVPNEKIISVRWDNGSMLNLITTTDAWKKVEPKDITEQVQSDDWKFIVQNSDIFENFDWRWLREFLYKVRESGIVNMLGASPLLYSGKEHIERYYGEGNEDDDNFQEMLEMSDESKNKMIQGTLSYMEKNGKNLDDINLINRYIKNFAQKILGLYVVFSEYRE